MALNTTHLWRSLKSSPRAKARTLRLENLESRELLSATTPGDFEALAMISSSSLVSAAQKDDAIDLSSIASDGASQVVVTTLSDDAETVGSLRYAIANASPGDEITFDASLQGGAIKLSGESLAISKNLTINATSLLSSDGAPGITIDCDHLSRAFTVTDAEAVSIQGIQITNGAATGSTTAEKYGGAIYSYGAALTVTDCAFENNTSASLGGALYAQTGTATVVNSTFDGNTSTRGAAIYLHTANGVLENVSVTNNTGTAAGAVFAMQCELEARDSVFSHNTSGGTAELLSGGAVGLFSNYGQYPYMPANGAFTNCVFSENSSTVKNGGAISANAGLVLTLDGCVFSGNTAKEAGGAVSLEGSELNVTRTIFTGNTTDGNGGAIYTSSANLAIRNPETGRNVSTTLDATVTIDNTLAVENEASRGGAFYFGNETTFDVVNATVTGNKTTGSSSTIYLLSGSGAITNSIVAANNGADVSSYNGGISGNAVLSSSATWSNANEEGTVNYAYDATQPLFTDVANGDYTLAVGSQALDRGLNAYATEYDLAGEERVMNGKIDLGAYESQGPFVLNVPALETTVVANSIVVSWNAVENATGYELVYANNRVLTFDADATSTTLSGLLKNKSYTIKVRAIGDGGAYLDSDYATIIAQTGALPTVGVPVISGVETTNSSIAISWDAVENASSYKVAYRAVGESTFTTKSVVKTQTSFELTGLDEGASYEFKVLANGNGTTYGKSDYSAVATATAITVLTPLATPTIVDATPTATTITLTWEAVENATGYEILCANRTISVDADATSYTISSLANGKSFTVKLCALGNDVEYSASSYAETSVVTTSLTQLDAPAIISVETTSSSIAITWDAVENAASYKVAYRLVGETDFTTKGVVKTKTSFELTGLEEGASYEFKVLANGDAVASKRSAYSAVATASAVDASSSVFEELDDEFFVDDLDDALALALID